MNSAIAGYTPFTGCATRRKVMGSISDGVTGFFYWHNPSGCTMTLGLTQPLTEMSARDIFWGVKWPVRTADIFTTFMCRLSWNLGTLNCWNPQGLSRPVMGLLYLQSLYWWMSLGTGIETCRYALVHKPKCLHQWSCNFVMYRGHFTLYHSGVSTVAVEWLAHVFRVLQDPFSYLSPQTGYTGGVFVKLSDAPGKCRSAC
jgi:hypothetical protein